MKILKIGANEWTVSIRVGDLKRVKGMTGIDLVSVIEPPKEGEMSLIEKLYNDPVLISDVVYALIQPQAQHKNITSEQFVEDLTGEDLQKATDIILDEIEAFFPEPKKGALRMMHRELNKAMKEAEAEMQRMFGETSMSVQA